MLCRGLTRGLRLYVNVGRGEGGGAHRAIEYAMSKLPIHTPSMNTCSSFMTSSFWTMPSVDTAPGHISGVH